MKPMPKEAGMSFTNISDTIQLSFSHWFLKLPGLILDLTKYPLISQEKLSNV